LENWFDYDEINKKKIFSTKNRPLYAFGVGKRDCLGRQLVEKELHIILGHLILNFEFSFYNQKDYSNPSKVEIQVQRNVTSFVDPPIGVAVHKRKN